MSDSIASGLRDNRRLATFSIDRPHEFLDYLRTRYDSEVEAWISSCEAGDWKYPFLIRERQIRTTKQRLARLEELAELW